MVSEHFGARGGGRGERCGRGLEVKDSRWDSSGVGGACTGLIVCVLLFPSLFHWCLTELYFSLSISFPTDLAFLSHVCACSVGGW